MKVISAAVCFVLGLAVFANAAENIQLLKIKGQVQVRKGLNEHWMPAKTGMMLDYIDTIQCGEDAEAVLHLGTGLSFVMSQYSILDISDLRQINDRELFRSIMSKKILNLPETENPPILHIQKVSVVRGASQAMQDSGLNSQADSELFKKMEMNGARALVNQSFYPNGILKYHRIINKHGEGIYQIEAYLNTAHAFEKINQPGHARQCYEKVLILSGDREDGKTDNEAVRIANEGLVRLKAQN